MYRRARRLFDSPVGPDPARGDSCVSVSCASLAAAWGRHGASNHAERGPCDLDKAHGRNRRSRSTRGGLSEHLLGRSRAGADVVIPVRQIAASEPSLERPPERAQDCQRARRRVVGSDLEAQQVVDVEG